MSRALKIRQLTPQDHARIAPRQKASLFQVRLASCPRKNVATDINTTDKVLRM